MESSDQPGSVWYARLDRFLLYLLAIELGYFVLMMLAGIIMALVAFAGFDLDLQLGRYVTGTLWPVLLYILALPLNMLGGFAGIVLNIRTKHVGYPGTGHLLNWIFLMTTAWIFIVLVFALPPMASSPAVHS
jgi:hypothetical protein